ncbi:PRC-barrel domain-containing protein [Paenibacillus sp. Marseille-Q4541]|uniref:PRC-barrel domain-containing protein n=1 Tax=Paenibacillus sp. Marseille-Q4541 TaxID=2831522 RepID=UPI001BA58D26|nr:PRC-barrel domain-containing protein [Paenibacillus sp. Marseille-Q4541]
MKFQEMIGLAVYDVEEGKHIGKICDFILTNDWQLTGIELDGRAPFSKQVKTVSWEDIVAYGKDAVMIRNKQAVRKTDADNIQYSYLKGHHKLRDMTVLTQEGLQLGRITDVYFDQQMGKNILGLEISDGFVMDLMEGRKWLPRTNEMMMGEHTVVVPTASEQHLVDAIHSVNG